MSKAIIIVALLVLMLPLISAVSIGYSNSIFPGVQITPPTPGTNYSTIEVNNSFFWQGYTPTTLPHNILSGLDGGTLNEFYHLSYADYLKRVFWYNQTTPAISSANAYTDAAILNISNGTFVPYTGATGNVDLGNYNLSAAYLQIPTGGALNFRRENNTNNSFMRYNMASQRVELWANGILQQDWGNSTTIYGKATFQADAFFQNLSGEGLFINTNVIVDGYMKVYGNGTMENVFAGNICYSDGTNCTAFNSSLGNLTQLILNMNQTLWAALDTKLNITDQRYNETAYINSVINASWNESYANTLYAPILWGYNQTIFSSVNGPYLYNLGPVIYFNDTKLNATIRDLAEVKAYTETIPVTVSGGAGYAVSANHLDFLITQVIVTPSSNATKYRFEANETQTGDVIDTNRVLHTGVWNIYKDHSLLNQTVSVHIFNSNPASETFTVEIKYIDNFRP